MQNLAELRDQIKMWSERDDIDDTQLNHFIFLTEQDYKQDFFLPANEIKTTLLTDSEGEAVIPFDYLKAKHLKVLDTQGNLKPVLRKPNEAVTLGGNFQDVGVPAYFERDYGSFIFAPNIGQDVEIFLTYYAVIPSLIELESVDPNQINFVLAVMPTVYLFGALMFLHQYTFNEERASYYERLYNQAKVNLIEMQAEAEMSGSTLSVLPSMTDNGAIF